MDLGGKSHQSLGLDESLEINSNIDDHDQPSKPFKRKLVWPNIVVYVLGHIFGLWGFKVWLCDTSWAHFFIGYAISYSISLNGVMMGAHRYYAHKCFKASKALQLLMIASQTAASQNCLWVWVRDHRQHHKYSDTDADPHNARNGFFFSHVGWLLSKKHPDVIEKGKAIDMSDLDADPFVMFQKRHYIKLWFLAILLPVFAASYLTGDSVGKCIMLWVAFRLFLSLNITWFVNSWAHMYGTRPFDKNLNPAETYFVSFVTLGEGWHNYHHVFPWDYKASEFGAPLNLVASYIRFLARLGLIWDLKEASDEMVVSRAERTGDGHPIRTHTKGKVQTD